MIVFIGLILLHTDYISTHPSPASFQMSKNLDETPEIGVMWQAARLAIAQAESILLFGFSMPTSDELLMQMIRTAIQEKENSAASLPSISIRRGSLRDSRPAFPMK